MIEPLIAPRKKRWFADAVDGFYFLDRPEDGKGCCQYSVVKNGQFEFSVVRAYGSAVHYADGFEPVPFEKAWDVLITRYPDVAEYFLFNPEKIK